MSNSDKANIVRIIEHAEHCFFTEDLDLKKTTLRALLKGMAKDGMYFIYSKDLAPMLDSTLAVVAKKVGLELAVA